VGGSAGATCGRTRESLFFESQILDTHVFEILRPLDLIRRPFQLGNRSDDYDHRTTQWSARVDVFSKADEFYAQAVQLIEDFQEMAHTPGYSVECGDENDVKAVPTGIGQKLIETGTPRFRAGNNIGVLVHDLISALFRHLPEVEQLRFWMLVGGAYACVDGDSFCHFSSFFLESR
jgi:hypothetical protein